MKNLNRFLSLLPLALLLSCAENQGQTNAAPALTSVPQPDTCEGPDMHPRCCFAQMPPNLNSVMEIASADEPGERLVIRGRILEENKKTPVAGAILYCYHTNAQGIYPKKGDETGVLKWHGYLHGWCKTDSAGNYEIRTIRPARYPSNNAPAHIHPVIWVSGKEAFYLSDFVFADDSQVNERYLRFIRNTPGGTGIVNAAKNAEGTWEGTRDIFLDLK